MRRPDTLPVERIVCVPTVLFLDLDTVTDVSRDLGKRELLNLYHPECFAIITMS